MAHLRAWRSDPHRKPAIIRGARQVGKSTIAHLLGREFQGFVEANFEIEPGLASIFERDLEPSRIVRDLSLTIGKKIDEGKTLLFLDEIQACPAALASLRYFQERMPGLHVIVAGSLIDFSLQEVGVPVGRVTFFHLYPMTFLEFLTATGNDALRESLGVHDPGEEMPAMVHEKLLGLLGQYMAVGGMPESVARWVEKGDLRACGRVQEDLVGAYAQDFSKYARRNQRQHVRTVFEAIPRLLGRKFVFSSVASEVKSRTLRSALDLLATAQVAHVVRHSSSNGEPLGAEADPGLFKVILLDVALAQRLLGLDTGEWILRPEETIVNRGAICEAFVGQEILACGPPTRRSELFYWAREQRGSMAEVDYVVAAGGKVVPIEVKSGATGRLRSMRLFLETRKGSPFGVQVSRANFGVDGPIRRFPLYAVSRMMEACASGGIVGDAGPA